MPPRFAQHGESLYKIRIVLYHSPVRKINFRRMWNFRFRQLGEWRSVSVNRVTVSADGSSHLMIAEMVSTFAAESSESKVTVPRTCETHRTNRSRGQTHNEVTERRFVSVARKINFSTKILIFSIKMYFYYHSFRWQVIRCNK